MRLAHGRVGGNEPSKKTVDRPGFLKHLVSIRDEDVSSTTDAAPKFRR
jgi:hypothetical protein